MNELHPILIRAFGRSGTTLAMQLVATSDRVAMDRRYPYEDRFLSYFCRMSNVLDAERKASDPSWGDHEVNLAIPPYVGALPYLPTDLFDITELKRRTLIALWQAFSESVRSKWLLENPGKSPLTYYAEKIPFDLVPLVSRALQGVKTLSMVRDPRGELASIIRFNAKRGFKGFGWGADDSEETFAKRMIPSRTQFLRDFDALRRSKDPAHFVLRYEDLVANGYEVAESLSNWLGVELSMKKVEADREKLTHHLTTSSGPASIDAWRHVLTENVQELFANSMSNELQLFEYPSE